MKHLKKWILSIILAAGLGILALLSPERSTIAIASLGENLLTMLGILPAIFILIGLMDAWISREQMTRYLGQHSGPSGFLAAFAMGFLAAGPLYIAFPVAALLIKKGARLALVFFFLGVWSTSKLPFLMFELNAFGPAFTLLHMLAGLGTFFIASLIMEAGFTQGSRETLEQRITELK